MTDRRVKPGASARAYRRVTPALVALASLYTAVWLAQEAKPGRAEIFPFASWNLFSWVPNEVRDVSLRILAIDGVPLQPPLYIEESAKHFVDGPSHPAHAVIELIGQAVQQGREADAEALRLRFEKLYMPASDAVRYELVARAYDPMKRWRNRVFAEERVLRTYEKGSRAAAARR